MLHFEEYDAALHPDATIYDGADSRPAADVVEVSPHDPEVLVVYERLHIILPRNTVANAALPECSTRFERDFFPLVDEPILDVTLVYLDGDFANHEPAKDRNGQYREGVHVIMHIDTTLDAQMLRKEQFPITRNDEGQEVFNTRAEIIVSYSGDQNVRIGWKVKAKGHRRRTVTVWQDEEKVCEELSLITRGMQQRQRHIALYDALLPSRHC